MTGFLGRNDILNTKYIEFNSVAISDFGTNRQGFAASRSRPEYVSVKKALSEKDCIIVAFTCRRSVQFGCYVT